MKLSEQLESEMVLISPEVANREELFQKFGEIFAEGGVVESAALVVERLLDARPFSPPASEEGSPCLTPRFPTSGGW